MYDNSSQEMAKRLISYFGGGLSVDLRRETTTIDPITGNPSTVVQTDTTYGCFIEAVDALLATGVISLEDRVLQLPSGLAFEPDDLTIIKVDGTSYRVIQDLTKQPGESVHYHKFVIREAGS